MSHLRLVSIRANPGPADAQNGAEHACVAAFERETDYVLRTLRRLGVSPNDVEDLAQEVFLVLYQSWDNKYDPSRPLRGYLFGIAFRVTANYLRKRKREVLYAVMEPSDVGPRADEILEAQQVRTLVLSALERVPLERRAVLIMHDIDRLPMTDIANNLSIYRFTGYSRLRKARQEFAAAVSSLLGARKP